jgi:hypothetical protein
MISSEKCDLAQIAAESPYRLIMLLALSSFFLVEGLGLGDVSTMVVDSGHHRHLGAFIDLGRRFGTLVGA